MFVSLLISSAPVQRLTNETILHAGGICIVFHLLLAYKIPYAINVLIRVIVAFFINSDYNLSTRQNNKFLILQVIRIESIV